MGRTKNKSNSTRKGAFAAAKRALWRLFPSAAVLQRLILGTNPLPPYQKDYADSHELMAIYKLLIDLPTKYGFSFDDAKRGNVISTDSYASQAHSLLHPANKLYIAFGGEFRTIVTYRAAEDFTLKPGKINEAFEDQVPAELGALHRAREIYRGQYILVRADSRDRDAEVDVQVLESTRSVLEQNPRDEWRVFTMPLADFLSEVRRHLTLQKGEHEEDLRTSRSVGVKQG